MGGDDSQKLIPWRGAYSSPGRSKPQHQDIMLMAIYSDPATGCRVRDSRFGNATSSFGVLT